MKGSKLQDDPLKEIARVTIIFIVLMYHGLLSIMLHHLMYARIIVYMR